VRIAIKGDCGDAGGWYVAPAASETKAYCASSRQNSSVVRRLVFAAGYAASLDAIIVCLISSLALSEKGETV
jgi:hypothetical protein